MIKKHKRLSSKSKTLIVDLDSKFIIKVENAHNGEIINTIKTSNLTITLFPDDYFVVYFDDLEVHSGVMQNGDTLSIGD